MRKVILVDIDGTIALRGDRAPHDHDSSMEDAVNLPVVKIIDATVKQMGFPLILLSGRQEKYRDVTEYWLGTHNLFPYRHALLMRCTGDDRADEIVKEEIYRSVVEPTFAVYAVFDDRAKVVAMWRRIGLTCLQVAEGNF